MKVKIYPYRRKVGMGNIIWPTAYPMHGGKFPPAHPVGGGFCDEASGQSGVGENISLFRSRGYWASCFPEGDGITWKPESGQSDHLCIKDIQECFGWDIVKEGAWSE